MKEELHKEEVYIAPLIRVVEVGVEKGFAVSTYSTTISTSGNSEDLTPVETFVW